MIDYFALTLVHGLLIIGLFRIVQNDAIDPVKPAARSPRRGANKAQAADKEPGQRD